ncbi:MAG: hypothetical protein JSV25_10710 [Spirochaetota bacterium]|nr:MAG: hypothetical protein JSV25_10710 [Spirochaetota bacterium]
MKKLSIFVISFLIICINIGYSQHKTTNSEVDVTIKFYNKQIYYMNSPIVIEFQIVNQTVNPFLFISSYKKLYTFDFEIFTKTNRKVDHSKDWIINKRQYEAVLSDEITLKENEIYGVRIDINDWFDFNEPGEYIVRGVFYPNLITNPERKIFSENELLIRLHPPYTEDVREKERAEELKKVKAESFPPYEVVDLALQALMDKDYEIYFLYINFDKFILQFANAKDKYMDAHDIDKPLVIEEFKQYLEGKNQLEAIPYSDTIPADYEIEETNIKKRDAQVKVLETFKYINLIEKKRYTYHLHLYGDKWFIESYDVVNIAR